MKFLTILLTFALTALNGFCAEEAAVAADTVGTVDSTAVLRSYMQALNRLTRERDSLAAMARRPSPNAYYFQLLSFPTLYSGPLRQMMSLRSQESADPQLQRLAQSGRMLSTLYTRQPWLVAQTEADIMGQTAIRDDVNEKLTTDDRLSDKVAASILAPLDDSPVEIITRKPNWWKFSGNTSLQFAQNHFSKNWYQGGESNYSGNLAITLRANYNDLHRFNWENTLEAQLGFQTTDNDKNRSFRPTSNLLRFTTNFGYKAWKNWFYSLQVNMKTQIAPSYIKDTDDYTSDILSPLETTIAPGMKYAIAWGKKKRFTGTLNAAPLALKILYVRDDLLLSRFGLKDGSHHDLTFGPNVTLDTQLKLMKQVTWTSRIYWISNFSFTQIEWTNTIDLAVTKLISAKVYIYPRFDDSNKKYMNDNGRFWMFKEWMSLGLSYNF